MERTYTRLPLQIGVWPTNFVSLPEEFGQALRRAFPTMGVLPLRLQWTGPDPATQTLGPREAFVGWSGLVSSGSYIGVPRELAEDIDLRRAMDLLRSRGGTALVCNVIALKAADAPLKEEIAVEPDTADDWEIVDANAGLVEAHMLSQICVLGHEQKFCLFVGGSAKPVRFRVVKGIEPHTCGRLARESRVVVAPKPRALAPSNRASNEDQELQLPPGKPTSLRVQDLPFANQDDLFDAGRAYVSPASLRLLETRRGWSVQASARVLGKLTFGNQTGYVVLLPSEGVESGHVALPLSLRHQLGVELCESLVLEPCAETTKTTGDGVLTCRLDELKTTLKSSSAATDEESATISDSPVEVLERALAASPAPRAVAHNACVELDSSSWPRSRLFQIKLLNAPEVISSRDRGFLSEDETKRADALEAAALPTVVCPGQTWRLSFAASSSDPPRAALSALTQRREKRQSESNEAAEDTAPPALPGFLAHDRLSGGPKPTKHVSLPDSRVAEFDAHGVARDAETMKALESSFESVLTREGSAIRAGKVGAPPPGGVYLHGARGSGKSMTLQSFAARVFHRDGVHVEWIDCKTLKGSKRSSFKTRVESAVKAAKSLAPSLVVLDDLDVLAPAESNDPQTQWLIAYLLETFLELHRSTESAERALRDSARRTGRGLDASLDWRRHAVTVLASGSNKRSLSDALTTLWALDRSVELPPLSPADRFHALARCLRQRGVYLDESEEDGMKELARTCEGYVVADLDRLTRRALVLRGVKRNADAPQGSWLSDFEQAKTDFTPVGLVGAQLMKASETKWSDIGGLHELRAELKDTLQLPVEFAEIFDRSPQRLASGVLLYGPPGCGKTMLAGAVAQECGLNFISVKGPEVLSKYIGASEQAVRDLFARAASAAPCVMFFDEFDAVAPRRGSDSTGVTDRVVNQLLTFLDGVEGRVKGVYIMAATSRPDLIDPALLRPGRLDKQLFVGFPTQEERLDILRVVATRLTKGREDAALDAALRRVAETEVLFTGADLQAVLITAQIASSQDAPVPSLEVDTATPQQQQPAGITAEGVLRAAKETRPSVPEADRRKFDKLYEDFNGGVARSVGMGQDADKAETHQKVALM